MGPRIVRMEPLGADVLGGEIPELGGALFAFVFGSYGTPRFGTESDLDLAADFGRKLSAGELLEISSALSRRVDRSVDLIDLRSADPIISMQVLRTGRPFVVRDRHAFELFRMTAISRYLDWKLCRRPVEEAIWAAAHA